jgi:hypothetical protein
LEAAQQTKLLLIAGILRVARALRKSGIQPAAKIRVDAKPDTISISLEDFPESHPVPKALVVAKHLLESAIGKSIAFRALEKLEPLLPLEFPPFPVKAAVAGAD